MHIEQIENAIGALIGRSYRSLSTLLQRNFKEIGCEISIDQWVVLVGLYKNDGCTQQDLSAFCRKDKSSTARIIAGLEKKKLLLRKSDRNDKRNKRVFLTKTAKDLQQKLLHQVDKTIQTALHGQKEEDIETCKSVLRTLMINTNNALNLETTN